MIIRGCLLLVLLAGCAGPTATASGPSSPSLPASASATDGADASSGPSAVPRAVPPLPAEFPVHASMTARHVGPELTAGWRSDALPPDIYDFYRDALVSAGFVIDLEGPGGEVAVLRFHASDGTAYQLTFTGSGPVSVDLGPPRP